ncbi:uncharacterized protein LOC129591115 [Paramacrobiotus metropolitanus]|uniref:uncharacterized protein LOC129591115 n=1 Tax=Paramacrobiotus metropolitanus TaxID=2943436 RepID=UPI002445E500|nr:uncharacterized protein LOC129591115 [Paramacrobiotus metropolitanus]XP_055342622.1 uncharacterized protein LOC129591115 [Paramacrobiotus metropolitanus]
MEIRVGLLCLKTNVLVETYKSDSLEELRDKISEQAKIPIKSIDIDGRTYNENSKEFVVGETDLDDDSVVLAFPTASGLRGKMNVKIGVPHTPGRMSFPMELALGNSMASIRTAVSKRAKVPVKALEIDGKIYNEHSDEKLLAETPLTESMIIIAHPTAEGRPLTASFNQPATTCGSSGSAARGPLQIPLVPPSRGTSRQPSTSALSSAASVSSKRSQAATVNHSPRPSPPHRRSHRSPSAAVSAAGSTASTFGRPVIVMKPPPTAPCRRSRRLMPDATSATGSGGSRRSQAAGAMQPPIAPSRSRNRRSSPRATSTTRSIRSERGQSAGMNLSPPPSMQRSRSPSDSVASRTRKARGTSDANESNCGSVHSRASVAGPSYGSPSRTRLVGCARAPDGEYPVDSIKTIKVNGKRLPVARFTDGLMDWEDISTDQVFFEESTARLEDLVDLRREGTGYAAIAELAKAQKEHNADHGSNKHHGNRYFTCPFCPYVSGTSGHADNMVRHLAGEKKPDSMQYPCEAFRLHPIYRKFYLAGKIPMDKVPFSYAYKDEYNNLVNPGTREWPPLAHLIHVWLHKDDKQEGEESRRQLALEAAGEGEVDGTDDDEMGQGRGRGGKKGDQSENTGRGRRGKK